MALCSQFCYHIDQRDWGPRPLFSCCLLAPFILTHPHVHTEKHRVQVHGTYNTHVHVKNTYAQKTPEKNQTSIANIAVTNLILSAELTPGCFPFVEAEKAF